MKKTFDMTPSNSMEILESPLTLLPGVSPVFSVDIAGSGTMDISGISTTMKLYKGTKDISSTNLSGSASISGRTFLCKQITNLTPGDFVFYIYFNDGGIPTERFCRFSVAKEGV